MIVSRAISGGRTEEQEKHMNNFFMALFRYRPELVYVFRLPTNKKPNT